MGTSGSGAARLRPGLAWGMAAAVALLASASPAAAQDDVAAAEWPAYGRDRGGARFAPLSQIDRDTVRRLGVAWTYRTGDVHAPGRSTSRTAFQATPIMVGGTLFFSTPFSRVIALDAETGRERWTYDPGIDLKVDYGNQLLSRGVASWRDAGPQGGGRPCVHRIFHGTSDGRLIALDAADGETCADFGSGGQVALTDGVGDWRPGEYQVTAPPAILGDTVIVGSAIADYRRAVMPSGVVRAFDARTGAERWRWDPLDPTQDAASARTGAANVWAVISTDAARDLVFLATSAPSPDYYGGLRPGDNAHANALVALRGSTGEVVWARQLVRHDLWDYDVPMQPVLITVPHRGRETAAVAVGSKMGLLFVFDRETGEPLFEVEERTAPAGAPVAGEAPSPTQPVPVAPPPLTPQTLSAGQAFGVTAEDRDFCRRQMQGLRADGLYGPPSAQGTLQLPAYLGGMNWSGASFDASRNLLVTNVNNLAAAVQLFPRNQVDEAVIAGWKAALPASQQVEVGQQEGTPYVVRRNWLISPGGVPCSPPPWGSLVAVDLAAGTIRWSVPLGRMPELRDDPRAAEWGSINLGGAIATGGGLVFIAAARDNRLRAFDIESGRELWSGDLPAGGHATPMTYEAAGRQFVVIAAGGHGKLGGDLGDSLVAFALEEGR